MIRRAVAVVLLILTVSLPACTTAGDASALASRDAAGRLRSLAAAEARRMTEPAEVAVPPGIERSALAPRRDSQRAARSLPDALDTIAWRPTPDQLEPDTQPPSDPERADEALRLYLKGRDAAERGRHLAAVVVLEQAREIDPASAAILRQLARSYAAEGNDAKALEMQQRLLAIDPDDDESLFMVGFAALNQGQFELGASLLARPRASGGAFEHDPAAEYVAAYALHLAFVELEFDRAAIELAREVLDGPLMLDRPTRYAERIESVMGQRGELLQRVGDAHCRLGAFAAALRSYERAAQQPGAELHSLAPRVIYTNLRLGRSYAAQLELLTLLNNDGRRAGERPVLLADYVSQVTADASALARAVFALHAAQPDDPVLARSAARLLPTADGRRLLRSYTQAHRREIRAVADLLAMLAPDSVAAIDLLAGCLAAHPDLAAAYIDQYVTSLPRPTASLDLTAAPSTPARAEARSRLLKRVWALGEAWDACLRGLERFPRDDGLRLLRIELAGDLDERTLLDEAITKARDIDTFHSCLVRARALRETEQFERAIDAVERAAERTEGDALRESDALLEHARILLAKARPMTIDERRAQTLADAAALADRARRLTPARDQPYEVIAALHGESGPAVEARAIAEIVDLLREADFNSRMLAKLRAREELRRGDEDDAADLALVLVQTDPTDEDALGLLITAWQRAGRADEAIDWLREQLEERPGDPYILDQYVRLMLREQQAGVVESMLDHRLATNPRDFACLRLLELLYQTQGREAEMVDLAEQRLLKRPPGTRRALQLAATYARGGRIDQALDQLDWLAAHALEASQQHLTAAIGLCSGLDEGGPQRDRVTADLVERTVERWPDISLSVYTVGLRGLARLGQVDERFDALTRRAAGQGASADDFTIRGVLPWRDLAQRLIDDGHAPAAGRALRIRLASSDAFETEARALLASLIVAADSVSPFGAESTIELLESAATRGSVPSLPGMEGVPRLSQALRAASDLYTIVGNTPGADRLLRRTVQLDPDDGLALNNLGYLRLEIGYRDERTIAWIERAAELQPNDPNTLDTLGWLRYKQGRFEDTDDGPGAITLLERSLVASDEPLPVVLDHRGDALWRAGRVDEALVYWRQAQRILADPERRQRILQNYQAIQMRGWGLLVSDPNAMYHRDFGALLELIRQKIAAAEAGERPPLAPTFAESSIPE
jgi:tetratricopeptide (TPR) repeat protein